MWDTAVTDEEFCLAARRYDPNQLGLRVPAVLKYCVMMDENNMAEILTDKKAAELAVTIMRQGAFPNAHVVTLGYAPDGEPLGVVSKTAAPNWNQRSLWTDRGEDPTWSINNLKPGMRVLIYPDPTRVYTDGTPKPVEVTITDIDDYYVRTVTDSGYEGGVDKKTFEKWMYKGYVQKLGSAWDYDPDKDPDLREMIRRRLRELKPGMRVRSTYTREEGTIDSIEGEEIFIDWDDGDYSPVSVGAITPIDQGMQLKLADYDLWERGKDTPRLKSPKYDFVTMPGWGPNAHRWLLVSPHLGFSVFPLTVDAANDYIQNQGIEFIRWNELPEEVKQPIAKQLRQPETDRGFFKAPPPSQGLLF